MVVNVRRSGILLHPTSLPGRSPIGDLGRAAYQFVDFLLQARQSLWQILPLGPTGIGHSPYNARSSFSGNPLLISLDGLHHVGLLGPDEVHTEHESAPHVVDFSAAKDLKDRALRRAFERYHAGHFPDLARQYEQFKRDQANWLDDYALFEALHRAHDGRAWLDWHEPFVRRDPAMLDRWLADHSQTVEFHRFVQFLFAEQWSSVKRYANERGVLIVGDIPIYVALDSADVWANQREFLLDHAGRPLAVAGVPPDLFSKTGQLWGNPLYRWDRMAENDYAWWVERFRRTFELCDIVRVDHFRAFQAGWQVPVDEQTAVNGRWVAGPGSRFFQRVGQQLSELPIIVEDLGMITREVDELRDELGYPGMRVLQFAFGDDSQNPYLPHNYTSNSVVYTGTHDNDTTVGWYAQASQHECHHLERYLGRQVTNIAWDLIHLALGSVADLCIVPLQDVLELDSSARMNTPGTAEGNWTWRMRPGALTARHAEWLAAMTVLFGRDPRVARPRWS